MRGSPPRRTLLAAALAGAALLLGAAACDPDLPGRACSSDDDCFRDEICQGTSCVSGERGPGQADQDGDAALEDDAGVDAET